MWVELLERTGTYLPKMKNLAMARSFIMLPERLVPLEHMSQAS